MQVSEKVRAYPAIIKALLRELSPLLEIEGLLIENKGVAASIHYRRCHEPEAAREAILTALKSSPSAKGFHLLQSRMAIEIRPPVEINKGSAVLELISKHHLRGGIYLGDDLTDVDAFRSMHSRAAGPSFEGIAIAAINEESSPEVCDEADFTLNGVRDVERFLGWLVQNSG